MTSTQEHYERHEQTALLEGALAAQEQSRHSRSAFHMPEGSFIPSHHYCTTPHTARRLGFRDRNGHAPMRTQDLLARATPFLPRRTTTDGWTEALCPGEGGLQPPPFVKGNFTTTSTKKMPTESPREGEEPLLELYHAARRHANENQYQQRVFCLCLFFLFFCFLI